MFKIEDGVIYLTRGDSASINVTVKKSDGTEYEMQSGDTLTMTVRHMPSKKADAIMSVSVTGGTTLTIDHDATENADIGTYSADVQLTTEDGHVYTVWPELTSDKAMRTEQNWKNFILMPEVTI